MKKTILILFLIGLGIFCALSTFYFLEVKPELARRKAIEEVQQEEIKAQELKLREKPQAQKTERKLTKTQEIGTIDRQPLGKEAVPSGIPDEQKIKEGILWFDQGSSRYIVTLGTVHGISTGEYLDVYDGNDKIGQVEVNTSFDVISFVQPISVSVDFAGKSYYRVTTIIGVNSQ